MHGRVKVKTTAEQEEQKRREREKKLELFKKASGVSLDKIEKREFDDVGLQVTKQILSMNSDYSSLWNYRKDAFIHMINNYTETEMEKLFKEELEFLVSCLRNNPKSYGCWHHRCFIMLKMSNPDWKRELDLCNQFLQFDDRNFHCWDYRRFVVKHSKPKVSIEDEIWCTDKLVENNFSNYSSWHYRSKLLPLRYPSKKTANHIEESKLLEELELVQNAFFTDPNDQSAWFYHRWLLGRGDRKQHIIAVYCERDPLCLTCIFRNPVSISVVESTVFIETDGTQREGIWESSEGSGFQLMWMFKCLTPFEGKEVTIKYEKQSIILQFSNDSGNTTYLHDAGQEFKHELSSAKLELLESELESCLQLNDLEPGNKWAVLTLVLLMRAIDPLKYEAETRKYLDDLKSIDPVRKEYYRDLASKYIIEDCLSNLGNSKEVDLSGNGLSRLCHLQYFSGIVSLNISKNSLRRLDMPFCVLQCCEVLIADKNEIDDISGVQNMPKLARLSLISNRLISAKNVEALTSCPKLVHLNLHQNNIPNDEILIIQKKLEDMKIEI